MKACFSPYGAIESIRWRSIAFDAKLPRKVAFAKKLFHTERDTLTMYLVFEEKQDITSPDGIKITSGQEAAKKALDLNTIFNSVKIEEVIRMRKEGFSAIEIAKNFNSNRGTITKILKKNKFKFNDFEINNFKRKSYISEKRKKEIK